MNELVSVIVPVYNTGKYLAPCLESLIAQTYRNLEIILVDDGSTDGSGAVCDEFASRDARVKVIHQENGGVSAARNAGIASASGSFLTFVDSDDTLLPHALESAMRCMCDTNADLVTYGWQTLHMADGRREEHCADAEICTDIPTVIREVLMRYSAYGGGYPWNKLWRAGTSVPRFDPELYYFEDLEWVIRMLLPIRKIAVYPDCLYQYRIHPGSVSNDPAKKERRELGYHRSIERIIENLEGLPELQQWFLMKYAPEIVNGLIGAVQNRHAKLRVYLSQRLCDTKDEILHTDSISPKIKFRCRCLHVLQLLHLL